MTQKEEERIINRIRKGIGRCVTGCKWSFRGTSFVSDTYYGLRDSCVWVEFTATFNYVKACVVGEHNGLANCEKTFTGDDALSNAIMWAADKFWEMHQIVVARIAPYKRGQEEFIRAWEGRI